MNITVQISDKDFKRFRLSSDKIVFKDFINSIKTELAKQALDKCNAVALKVGLSEITDDEINAEIEAVRNAKGNS